MPKPHVVIAIAVFIVSTMFFSRPAAAQIERVGVKEGDAPEAVIVSAKHLVFTSQIFPTDREGNIVDEGDLMNQMKTVLGHLEAALQKNVNGKLSDVARLNVYLTDHDLAAAVHTAILESFPYKHCPTVTLVVTPLPLPGALIAIDAVAVYTRELDPKARRQFEATRSLLDNVSLFGGLANSGADTLVIPGDRLILVSGQAEPGELRESVRKTCDSLIKTVKLAGGEADSIAQVKIFMNSVKDVPAVLEVMHAPDLFATNSPLPAISFVQWTSDLPPEIEVIAAQKNELPGDDANEPIRLLTPPWMKESPVYSKVAVTNSERLIFTSSLAGQEDKGSEMEVKTLFEKLEKVMKEAGSDLRHLGKATYYVTNDEVSKQLNLLRPNYYDPKRPPAASKAAVKSVGGNGLTISLDMIAVPAAKK